MAQLAKRSLSTPKVQGSCPIIIKDFHEHTLYHRSRFRKRGFELNSNGLDFVSSSFLGTLLIPALPGDLLPEMTPGTI